MKVHKILSFSVEGTIYDVAVQGTDLHAPNLNPNTRRIITKIVAYRQTQTPLILEIKTNEFPYTFEVALLRRITEIPIYLPISQNFRAGTFFKPLFPLEKRKKIAVSGYIEITIEG